MGVNVFDSFEAFEGAVGEAEEVGGFEEVFERFEGVVEGEEVADALLNSWLVGGGYWVLYGAVHCILGLRRRRLGGGP